MSKPFFSVIVPEHNAEEYMRVGLKSIREQGFTDYELIIVCDACTDNTAKIARQYGDKVLETNFARAGLARNAGLDVAEGEWILWMDDDDWYLKGAFQAIADEVRDRNDIDILAYGFEWKGMGYAKQSEQRIYPAIWNKAWRRDFIGDHRFPDWIHTDDLGFAKMMHPLARFGYLNEILYYYNFMRAGSLAERIRDGEFDNSQLPGEYRDAAEGYEKWLRSKEF